MARTMRSLRLFMPSSRAPRSPRGGVTLPWVILPVRRTLCDLFDGNGELEGPQGRPPVIDRMTRRLDLKNAWATRIMRAHAPTRA